MRILFTIENKEELLLLIELIDEQELDDAIIFLSKLRWIMEKDPSLKPLRDHIKKLIIDYEDKHWPNE